MPSEQSTLVVVLDPGHGGTAKIGGSSPNNAQGPNGLLEKDLTLDVATRTAALLSANARVIMTRTSDVNLSLSDRAAVARASKADVFVSIHFNGFHDASVDGTEVWVARSAGDASAQLAGEVLTELAAVTQAHNRGVRRSDLGVLLPARHAPTTAACLAEIAFLTNPDEASRLAGGAYRQQLAQALATAILSRVRVPATVGAPVAPPARSQGISGFVIDRLARYFHDEAARGIPLDPGAGGQSIGEDALQIGDIIVSTTDHASSRGIRFGTGSQVSHAKLYIGGGQIVEAVGQGTILRSLAESLADDTLAVAFRYPGITSQQQLMVRDFAGQQLDKPYNYLGIVRQALFQMESSNCDSLPDDLAGVCRNWVGGIVLGQGNNDTFFCSQLVLAAYANAGIPLTSTPPVWGSPEDVAELRLSGHLAYVGHLKAPAASAESLAVHAGAVGGDTEARRQAAAIGGFGAPPWPATAAFDTVTLGYGVAGGVITDPFYRDAAERTALTGRKTGRPKHLGMDVSTSNAHGGGADDPRRGLPVYAVIAPTIDISELNAVRAMNNEEAVVGLGIDGQGTASLQEAVVSLQRWNSQDPGAYGGVVGLACRYRYTKTDGSSGIFTLYIEYLHLITPSYLPKDGQSRVISAESWAATGKGIGFGPRLQNGAHLSAADLTGGDPLLVGYLGATEFPHVHIQAAYGPGEAEYLRTPRFDPTVMLRSTATTTQAWALGLPSLTLNDQSFHYDVPGTFEPIAQPTSMACWATVATMLISWRDQASYPIAAVCDMAGPAYRGFFDKNTGLARADKPAFLQRLGLQEEPPACYTIDAYKDMLRTYGPLWVTADVGSPGNVSIHARVMTGIYGDGSADNTFVWLVDPADGQRHCETFAHFSAALEQLALDIGATEPLWVQIVHNPPPPPSGTASFAIPSSAVSAVRPQARPAYRYGAGAARPLADDTAPHPVVAQIFEHIESSGLRSVSWRDIGKAPLGYLKGMALTYARVYCHYKLEPGEPENFRDRFAVKMAKAVAPGANTDTDAMARYAGTLRRFGADLSVDGVDVLRGLFTILIGLGMRESGGKHCTGRYRRKPEAPTATNSEAGLFQISYDIGMNAGDFKDLYDRYLQRPGSGFLGYFSEEVTCSPDDWDNFGAGVGQDFQQFSKNCPAFTAELAALGLRVRANHWGPINRNTVEIREDCWTLLKAVETAIDDLGGCIAVD